MPIVIIAVIVFGLLFLAVSHSKKEKKGGDWIGFYAKGREAGFSFKEIEMLRQLAVQSDLDFPSSLFWSQSQLDKCIHFLVRAIKMSNGNQEPGTQNFLSHLYDYRKKIEIDKQHLANGITSSRQINEGQPLRVLATGIGVFKSQVIKNTSHYLTIARPVSSKANSAAIPWPGMQISVYFWREDDAGYVFDSEVQDEVYSLGMPSLKINASDSLFRTQKRKSVRMNMHKAAFMYLVRSGEPSHKIEMDPGLKCFLEDISDTGCAVTVGGRADSGIKVKVQFALNNTAICMSGIVRSVDFKKDTNRSMLHIEAEPLPLEVRNLILGEMFGMMPGEDEDELPFRVLDDKAEGVNKDQGFAAGGMPVMDSIAEAFVDSEDGETTANVMAGIAEGRAQEAQAS